MKSLSMSIGIHILLSITSNSNAMHESSDGEHALTKTVISAPITSKVVRSLRKINRNLHREEKHSKRKQRLNGHLVSIVSIHEQLQKILREYKECSVVPYVRVEKLKIAAYNATKPLEQDALKEWRKEKKYKTLHKEAVNQLIKKLPSESTKYTSMVQIQINTTTE